MSDTKTDEKTGSDAKAKPAAPARRAVEKIAFERGMLPELKLPTPPRPGMVVQPEHNPMFALFARAQITHQWPVGKELTDKEFDDAIEASEKKSVYR